LSLKSILFNKLCHNRHNFSFISSLKYLSLPTRINPNKNRKIALITKLKIIRPFTLTQPGSPSKGPPDEHKSLEMTKGSAPREGKARVTEKL